MAEERIVSVACDVLHIVVREHSDTARRTLHTVPQKPFLENVERGVEIKPTADSLFQNNAHDREHRGRLVCRESLLDAKGIVVVRACCEYILVQACVRDKASEESLRVHRIILQETNDEHCGVPHASGLTTSNTNSLKLCLSLVVWQEERSQTMLIGVDRHGVDVSPQFGTQQRQPAEIGFQILHLDITVMAPPWGLSTPRDPKELFKLFFKK